MGKGNATIVCNGHVFDPCLKGADGTLARVVSEVDVTERCGVPKGRMIIKYARDASHHWMVRCFHYDEGGKLLRKSAYWRLRDFKKRSSVLGPDKLVSFAREADAIACILADCVVSEAP